MNGAGRYEDWQSSTQIIIMPPIINVIYLQLSAVLTFLTISLFPKAPAAAQALVWCVSSISLC